MARVRVPAAYVYIIYTGAEVADARAREEETGEKTRRQPFDRFECVFNRKVIVLFCINTVQVTRTLFVVYKYA